MRIHGEINSLESWFEISPPKEKDRHWRDGRSAKELARYFTKNMQQLPTEIKEFLAQYYSITTDNFVCYPEFITHFDNCKGEGRNHDMLMVAEDNSIVVGIEAKSDESLGDYVSKENISKNKLRRINKLVNDIFGDAYVDLSKIRYQLLTATAGTLCEAKIRNIKQACLLILTFKKDGCFSENKIKQNENDLSVYTSELTKIYGDPAFNLRGYNNIQFSIKHINIAVKD